MQLEVRALTSLKGSGTCLLPSQLATFRGGKVFLSSSPSLAKLEKKWVAKRQTFGIRLATFAKSSSPGIIPEAGLQGVASAAG